MPIDSDKIENPISSWCFKMIDTCSVWNPMKMKIFSISTYINWCKQATCLNHHQLMTMELKLFWGVFGLHPFGVGLLAMTSGFCHPQKHTQPTETNSKKTLKNPWAMACYVYVCFGVRVLGCLEEWRQIVGTLKPEEKCWELWSRWFFGRNVWITKVAHGGPKMEVIRRTL